MGRIAGKALFGTILELVHISRNCEEENRVFAVPAQNANIQSCSFSKGERRFTQYCGVEQSGQLVGLITRRSLVQIQPPRPITPGHRLEPVAFFFASRLKWSRGGPNFQSKPNFPFFRHICVTDVTAVISGIKKAKRICPDASFLICAPRRLWCGCWPRAWRSACAKAGRAAARCRWAFGARAICRDSRVRRPRHAVRHRGGRQAEVFVARRARVVCGEDRA